MAFSPTIFFNNPFAFLMDSWGVSYFTKKCNTAPPSASVSEFSEVLFLLETYLNNENLGNPFSSRAKSADDGK